MRKSNKKGFTIVELVIVIAVIAILSVVMIPTFGGIIEKANKSAAQQEAAALWKETYALDLADGSLDGVIDGVGAETDEFTVSGKTVTWDGTDFSYTTLKGYECSYDGTTWNIEAPTNP